LSISGHVITAGLTFVEAVKAAGDTREH